MVGIFRVDRCNRLCDCTDLEKLAYGYCITGRCPDRHCVQRNGSCNYIV